MTGAPVREQAICYLVGRLIRAFAAYRKAETYWLRDLAVHDFEKAVEQLKGIGIHPTDNNGH